MKGSDDKTKERPSDKKLTPLQRAEQAHEIIVKECEELIGHHLSHSDDETKLLVCNKLLEYGGGLTEHELIAALWDELKKVLKKRSPGEPMSYEAGQTMIGTFLQTYSDTFLEIYSSVSPIGKSYSVLTREIVNRTADPDRYYLTPQTDSDDKPMPDYYALYLMYKKKLNNLNDMSAEARKRRASIILLEKQIYEFKEELRHCPFFDFKTKREVKDKIAGAQKRIDENDRFVRKANSEEQHHVEYQKKLDEVNESINANASRFREVPIQRTGLPRRGAQKKH